MSTQAPTPAPAAPAAAPAAAPTPTPAPAPAAPTPAPAPPAPAAAPAPAPAAATPAPADAPSGTPAPTSAVGAIAEPAPAPAPAPAAAPAPDAQKPADAPLKPEDYAKAVTLGDAEEFKGVALNPDVINAIIPVAQELGIKPEQMSRLAQEMTRALSKQNAQLAQAEQEKQTQKFNADRQTALDTLKPEGIADVRVALEKYLKPGSFFKYMVDMGLGNDLDFLAMCRDYGRLIKTDDAPGAGDGTGRSGNGYDWKGNWGEPGGAQ